MRHEHAEDYRRVAAAIEYLDHHAREQPSLDDVADAVGLSPYHFHRMFRRWAGTTPKRFLQLQIPEGRVASYGDVADGVGRPRAVRAVAGAVARNRVAWLIPCHRVIRKVGEAGGYRWGTDRKRAMLAWESVRAQ